MKGQRQANMDQGKNSPAVRLGEGAVIDAGVFLGYPPARGDNHLLIIGPNARIRIGTVIYGDSCIGCNLETGHNVIIREQNLIGDNLRIWSNSTIDYGCKIGDNVKIHHNVYITQFTTVEEDAFLGPGVTLANDVHPGCPEGQGGHKTSPVRETTAGNQGTVYLIQRRRDQNERRYLFHTRMPTALRTNE